MNISTKITIQNHSGFWYTAHPNDYHKFLIAVYTKYEGIESIHTYLGPFDTISQAKVFASDYKEKCTKPGFISKTKIFPLCEVVKDT